MGAARASFARCEIGLVALTVGCAPSPTMDHGAPISTIGFPRVEPVSAVPSAPAPSAPATLCPDPTPRYAPFAVANDRLLEAPEAQEVVGAAMEAFVSQNDGRGECDIAVNDGHLLVLSCDGYEVVAGSPRASESSFVIFERGPGERLTELDRAALLPMVAEVQVPSCAEGMPAMYPTRDGLAFSEGFGGVNQSSCLVPFDEAAGLLGCGALAAYAGRRSFSPPSGDLGAMPLAVQAVQDPRAEPRLTYVEVESLDGTAAQAASAINEAVQAHLARYAEPSFVNVDCRVTVSMPALLGILCSGNAGDDVWEGITFRLGATPGPISSADLFGRARPGALQSVADVCLKDLRRPSQGDYDFVLAKMPSWRPSDVGFALFDLTRSWFFAEVELIDRAGNRRKQVARCIVEHGRLGLTLEHLLTP